VVQCTDPLAAIDIPNLLGQSGDAIEGTRREAGVTTFRIRKRWRCRACHTGTVSAS